MDNTPRKFILWFIILFVVAVLLIGIFYFDNSRMILKNQYIESFDSSVVQLDHSISEFISTFESALEMFSQNEMIQNVSDNPEQYYLPARQLFKSFQQSYPSIAFAYFAPTEIILGNKKLVTWPDTSEELEYTDWIANQRPWYINAVKANEKTAWTKPYLDATTKKTTITISKTVKNYNNEFKGVIAIDFFLDELSNKIENFQAFKQGYAFLIDQDKENYVFITKDINDRRFDKIIESNWIYKIYGRKSGSFYISENHVDYYVTYTTNDLTGWKVLGIIEEEKIYKKTKNMMQELFTSSFIIMFIGLICIAYISKQITKSVKDLSNFLNNDETNYNIIIDKNNDLSNKFNLILSENKDYEDLLDESNSYINLLFEAESEIEKFIGIINGKLINNNNLDALKELSNSIDRLLYFRDKFNDSSSKLQQIQKDNINNHMYLVLDKIKNIKENDNDNKSEIHEILNEIELKVSPKNILLK
ncbi:cache domain-containing protein [Marinisporobacter balticus]|uniref:Cache domain-containing protein n=1 Tax=Marinisporobacter balticus TaxID=2018667 RepID=A0A4R2KUE8_9FIRM|nr:cache domain-containing protein [Marinisporobacter balticus]TCO77433.1 cache domain-containing protein [Marinisporobacter balticus]